MAQEPSKARLQELADKWLKGAITPSEQQEFDEWFKRESDIVIDVPGAVADSEEAHRKYLLDRIQKSILEDGKPKVRRLWPRIAVAASILLCCCSVLYLVMHKHRLGTYTPVAANLITPGSSKAILILASGKRIILTGAKNGQLAQQENTIIIKTTAGQIAYVSNKSEIEIGKGLNAVNSKSEIKYDTLTIPRNGQFQLKLADGTEVWLNAATTIRYPEDFAGDKRQVELISGEAYFEVVHDQSRPFSVIVKGQTVEDLGTHFNINAYDDEPVIKTTLLQGSIRIDKNGRTAALRPGQQSITKMTGNSILICDADTEEVVAWKNGYFKFDNEKTYKALCAKFLRWYDVDIQYEGAISKEEFGGKMSRYKNVSEVLEMLELTRSVHFKIAGRRITVMP